MSEAEPDLWAWSTWDRDTDTFDLVEVASYGVLAGVDREKVESMRPLAEDWSRRTGQRVMLTGYSLSTMVSHPRRRRVTA